MSELEQVLGRALAVYEAFRRLKLEPDEIFFWIGGEEPPYSIVMLAKRGEKEAAIKVGDLSESREEIIGAWKRAARDWNSTTDAERQAVWTASDFGNPDSDAAFRIVDLLMRAGLYAPKFVGQSDFLN